MLAPRRPFQINVLLSIYTNISISMNFKQLKFCRKHNKQMYKYITNHTNDTLLRCFFTYVTKHELSYSEWQTCSISHINHHFIIIFFFSFLCVRSSSIRHFSNRITFKWHKRPHFYKTTTHIH